MRPDLEYAAAEVDGRGDGLLLLQRLDRKFLDTSNEGTALAILQGAATRYWIPHFHKGGIEFFTDDCFDKSLASGDEVKFCLDHDIDKIVTTTNGGLELMSDAEGLSFRCAIPDTEYGQAAMRMISAGKGQAGMSVGYLVVKSVVKELQKIPTRILQECQLTEISIVKTGAVPGTFAMPVPKVGAADAGKSIGDAEVDAAAINFRWALKDLTSNLEGLAAKVSSADRPAVVGALKQATGQLAQRIVQASQR